MFHSIAENLADRFIRRDILDFQKREVSIYALEVLILNGGILVTMLVVSFLLNAVGHYFIFVAVFCPLRMVAGGIHAKTGSRCFVLSNGIYLLTIVLHKILLTRHLELELFIISIITIIAIYLTGPIERTGVTVSEKKREKHKTKLKIILTVNLLYLMITFFFRLPGCESICISLFLVKILQKKLKNFRRKCIYDQKC